MLPDLLPGTSEIAYNIQSALRNGRYERTEKKVSCIFSLNVNKLNDEFQIPATKLSQAKARTSQDLDEYGGKRSVPNARRYQQPHVQTEILMH